MNVRREREKQRERNEEEGNKTGAEIADLPNVTLLQRKIDEAPCVCHTATNLLRKTLYCLHHGACGM